MRPYRRGDRVRHVGLGLGTFIAHTRLISGAPTYLITFGKGPVLLLAELCSGRLRRYPRTKRSWRRQR